MKPEDMIAGGASVLGAMGAAGAADAEAADGGGEQPLYIAAHTYSYLNRKGVEASRVCGCFYCLSMFAPQDIDDWTDGVSTVLCPSCGIDSVIGDADVPELSEELLSQMYEYWF